MYDKELCIRGEKVTLMALSEEHTSLVVKWRNRPEVYRNLYTHTQITMESHLNYYHTQVVQGHCVQFIIYVNAGHYPVGSVFLKNFDTLSAKAEFGIFIGEDVARGMGYGSEAARLILEYGFMTLGLNRIYLSVLSNNMAAIRSYRNAGFKQEGLLRQDFRLDDEYVDVMLMAILASESK